MYDMAQVHACIQINIIGGKKRTGKDGVVVQAFKFRRLRQGAPSGLHGEFQDNQGYKVRVRLYLKKQTNKQKSKKKHMEGLER